MLLRDRPQALLPFLHGRALLPCSGNVDPLLPALTRPNPPFSLTNQRGGGGSPEAIEALSGPLLARERRVGSA